MGNTTFSDAITNFEGEYRWLSNFWPIQIEYEGVFYPTLENAYQAAKTVELHQRRPFEKYSPARAKSVGQYVFMRKNWDSIKSKVMEELLHKKFSDPTMKQLLLNTGERDLIEGNYWHDNFWGVCHCEKCLAKNAVPQNNLGKLLMKIRDEFRRTYSSGSGQEVEASR